MNSEAGVTSAQTVWEHIKRMGTRCVPGESSLIKVRLSPRHDRFHIPSQLLPLNLCACWQTDIHRGIALSGIKHSATRQYWA